MQTAGLEESLRAAAQMSKWGVVVLRILDALEQVGPMTTSEIAREIDVPRTRLGGVISRLNRPTIVPKAKKRIYIAEWRDDEENQRCYLRAVYAIGSKKDAEKPACKTPAERATRYRDRKRGKQASPFRETR